MTNLSFCRFFIILILLLSTVSQGYAQVSATAPTPAGSTTSTSVQGEDPDVKRLEDPNANLKDDEVRTLWGKIEGTNGDTIKLQIYGKNPAIFKQLNEDQQEELLNLILKQSSIGQYSSFESDFKEYAKRTGCTIGSTCETKLQTLKKYQVAWTNLKKLMQNDPELFNTEYGRTFFYVSTGVTLRITMGSGEKDYDRLTFRYDNKGVVLTGIRKLKDYNDPKADSLLTSFSLRLSENIFENAISRIGPSSQTYYKNYKDVPAVSVYIEGFGFMGLTNNVGDPVSYTYTDKNELSITNDKAKFGFRVIKKELPSTTTLKMGTLDFDFYETDHQKIAHKYNWKEGIGYSILYDSDLYSYVFDRLFEDKKELTFQVKSGEWNLQPNSFFKVGAENTFHSNTELQWYYDGLYFYDLSKSDETKYTADEFLQIATGMNAVRRDPVDYIVDSQGNKLEIDAAKSTTAMGNFVRKSTDSILKRTPSLTLRNLGESLVPNIDYTPGKITLKSSIPIYEEETEDTVDATYTPFADDPSAGVQADANAQAAVTPVPTPTPAPTPITVDPITVPTVALNPTPSPVVDDEVPDDTGTMEDYVPADNEPEEQPIAETIVTPEGSTDFDPTVEDNTPQTVPFTQEDLDRTEALTNFYIDTTENNPAHIEQFIDDLVIDDLDLKLAEYMVSPQLSHDILKFEYGYEFDEPFNDIEEGETYAAEQGGTLTVNSIDEDSGEEYADVSYVDPETGYTEEVEDILLDDLEAYLNRYEGNDFVTTPADLVAMQRYNDILSGVPTSDDFPLLPSSVLSQYPAQTIGSSDEGENAEGNAGFSTLSSGPMLAVSDNDGLFNSYMSSYAVADFGEEDYFHIETGEYGQARIYYDSNQGRGYIEGDGMVYWNPVAEVNDATLENVDKNDLFANAVSGTYKLYFQDSNAEDGTKSYQVQDILVSSSMTGSGIYKDSENYLYLRIRNPTIPALIHLSGYSPFFLTPEDSEGAFGLPDHNTANYPGNYITAAVISDLDANSEDDFTYFGSHKIKGSVLGYFTKEVDNAAANLMITGNAIFDYSPFDVLTTEFNIYDINPEQNIYISNLTLLDSHSAYRYAPLDYNVHVSQYMYNDEKNICFRDCGNVNDEKTVYVRQDKIGVVSVGKIGNVKIDYEGNTREVFDTNYLYLSKDDLREYTSSFNVLDGSYVDKSGEADLLFRLNNEAKRDLSLLESLELQRELYYQTAKPASYTNLNDKVMYEDIPLKSKGELQLNFFTYIVNGVRKLVLNEQSYDNIIELSFLSDKKIVFPADTFVIVDGKIYYAINEDLSIEPKVYNNKMYFRSPQEARAKHGYII